MSKSNNKKEDLEDFIYEMVSLAEYKSPDIVEDSTGEFVQYGDDNLYFDYLYKRFLNSPTNNALINGIVKFIYGKGIDATDSKIKPQEYAKFLKIVKITDLRKIAFDRKLLGMACFQIVYKNREIVEVKHFPMITLRAKKKNKYGEVTKWVYHPEWKEYQQGDDLETFDAFGHGNKEGVKMHVISRYMPSCAYYPPVEYNGSLAYSVIEEEIQDYLVNEVQNSFSGSKIINVNSSVPDKKKRTKIKNDILATATGAKGQKVMVGFSKGRENTITVEDISLNDAPEHYKYLSEESFEKICVSHGVTSPMLLGVKSGNAGLGNNAEEIKTASLLFDNMTIRTFQDEILDGLKDILKEAGINLDLYVKTLQPLEFTDIDENVVDKETKEKETGVKMQKELSDEEYENVLQNLEGEVLNHEWEIVDARIGFDENFDVKKWAEENVKPTKIIQLAEYIKQKANIQSSLDEDIYKIRFQYVEKYSSTNSRDFCKRMMSRTSSGVVYRLEDINEASFRGVNKSHGHKGKPYSLLQYKGGVNCGHLWEMQLYRLKKKTDGTFYKDRALSSSIMIEGSIPRDLKPKGEKFRKAKIAPKDMPRNGHHPNYRS